MKLTFKQYLESKEQLLKAIENVPVSINEYEVIHYCSLPLGEYEEDKELVGLKPKQKIVVEWKYDTVDDPTPVSIKLKGVQSIDEDDHYQTFWTGQKLQKWLKRHTRG
jgi:hypothetical protein